MRKLIGFNIKRNKKLLVSDIIKFYEVRGYELIDADAEGMVFKRGSVWGNMISLDPVNWYTKVDIDIIKKERLNYSIYAKYHFVTSGFFRSRIEDKFYDEELTAFSKAIENFEVNTEAIETLAEETNKSNFNLMCKSLLFGILTTVLIVLSVNSFWENRLPIGVVSVITIVAILTFYLLFVRARN